MSELCGLGCGGFGTCKRHAGHDGLCDPFLNKPAASHEEDNPYVVEINAIIAPGIPRAKIPVDVYSVCHAYSVGSVLAHAVKKLLMAGRRGKEKDYKRDLQEAIKTIKRAIELEEA
jgi:hypothetical protein